MSEGIQRGLGLQPPHTPYPPLWSLARTLAVLGVLQSSALAVAQEATAEVAPAPVEAAPVAEAPPEPEPTPEPAAAEPPAEAPAEEPAPAPPPALKIGVGVRTGLTMTMADGPVQLSLNDGLADQINIRPYMTGQLNEYIGVFTQFEIGTANGLGNFAILDAIAQVKLMDEFQIWIGQHIPANDRNNMNGPFFHNGWNFPIVVPAYPFDAGARDRGITFWGLLADGLVKYHLSMVDLQPGRELGKSRFAGRVTLQLMEPENFYYNSGTNYGGGDLLNIGGVVHYQAGQDLDTDDDGMIDVQSDDNQYLGFSIDGVFEKNLDSAGTVTLDAVYWNHKGIEASYVGNQGTVDSGLGVWSPAGQSFMAGASWLMAEKVGIGQLQPNVRIQYGDYDGSPKNTTIDVGLGYIIDGFNDRWYLNYRHVAVEDADGVDMLQVGLQLMM